MIRINYLAATAVLASALTIGGLAITLTLTSATPQSTAIQSPSPASAYYCDHDSRAIPPPSPTGRSARP